MAVFVGNKPSAAAVFLLLFACGPSTIGRFVISACVDSIKRLFGWSFAHVLQEGREFFPSFAYGYASTAVQVVLGVIGVFAPSQHAKPRVVLAAELNSECSTLLIQECSLNKFSKLSAGLCIKASAASGFTVSQITGGDLAGFAAIAIADPSHLWSAVYRSGSDDQHSESVTVQVMEWHSHARTVPRVYKELRHATNICST